MKFAMLNIFTCLLSLLVTGETAVFEEDDSLNAGMPVYSIPVTSKSRPVASRSVAIDGESANYKRWLNSLYLDKPNYSMQPGIWEHYWPYYWGRFVRK